MARFVGMATCLSGSVFIPGTLWVQPVIDDPNMLSATPSFELSTPPSIPEILFTMPGGVKVYSSVVTRSATTNGPSTHNFLNVDGFEVATGSSNGAGDQGAKIGHYIGVTQLPGGGNAVGLKTQSVRMSGVSAGSTVRVSGTIGYEMDHDNLDQAMLYGNSGGGTSIGMRIQSQGTYPALAALDFADDSPAIGGTFGWHYAIFVNSPQGSQSSQGLPFGDSSFMDLGAATTSFNVSGTHQSAIDMTSDSLVYAILTAPSQAVCFKAQSAGGLDACLTYGPSTPGGTDVRLRYWAMGSPKFSVDATGTVRTAGDMLTAMPTPHARGTMPVQPTPPGTPTTPPPSPRTAPMENVGGIAITAPSTMDVCAVSQCPNPSPDGGTPGVGSWLKTPFITQTHTTGAADVPEIMKMEDFQVVTGSGGTAEKIGHFAGTTQTGPNSGAAWGLNTDVVRGGLGIEGGTMEASSSHVGTGNSTTSVEVDIHNYDVDALGLGQEIASIVGTQIYSRSAYPALAGIYAGPAIKPGVAHNQYGFLIDGASAVQDNSFLDEGQATTSLSVEGEHTYGIVTVGGVMPYAITVAQGQSVCLANNDGCFSFDAVHGWLVFEVGGVPTLYIDDAGDAYFPGGYQASTTP